MRLVNGEQTATADLNELLLNVDEVLIAQDTILAEAVEIETHLHSNSDWLGLAAVPDAELHRADVNSLSPFVLDSGNNDFGTAICVLGSDDTPVRAGNTFFDFHKILVTATERANEPHIIRWAWGASEAAGLSAGDYSSEMFYPTAQVRTAPIAIQSTRIPAGAKLWVNVKCANNTGTVSLFVGLHEYEE